MTKRAIQFCAAGQIGNRRAGQVQHVIEFQSVRVAQLFLQETELRMVVCKMMDD